MDLDGGAPDGQIAVADMRLKLFPEYGDWLWCTMTHRSRPSFVASNRAARTTLVVALLGCVVLGSVAVGTVGAHETETVDGYELTFGGADEPVITGERMWLELEIVDEDGEPVPDQAETLTMEVEHPDGMTRTVDLEGKHGAPAYYEAPIVFTEAGTYTIHVEGTLEDAEVHTHFEKEVHDRSELAFPATDGDDGEESAEAQEPVSLSGAGFGAAAAVVALGALVSVLVYVRRD